MTDKEENICTRYNWNCRSCPYHIKDYIDEDGCMVYDCSYEDEDEEDDDKRRMD